MPWKEVKTKSIAKKMGVDIDRIREKRRLIDLIIKARKKTGLTQAQLAKKLKVSQVRISHIESGIEKSKVSFEILFDILKCLGYQCKVVARKAA